MADQDQPPEERRVAQDWLTLWQSEMAALAVDREAAEHWQAAALMWTRAASTLRPPATAPDAGEGRAAAPDAKARAAPPDAAPDPRDDEIRRLREQLDTLERRLAEPERKRATRKRK